MQQNIAFWYLFNFIIKEVSNTNITLGHLLLKATSERLGEKKAHVNFFDRSCIWGIVNAQYPGYGKTE